MPLFFQFPSIRQGWGQDDEREGLGGLSGNLRLAHRYHYHHLLLPVKRPPCLLFMVPGRSRHFHHLLLLFAPRRGLLPGLMMKR